MERNRIRGRPKRPRSRRQNRGTSDPFRSTLDRSGRSARSDPAQRVRPRAICHLASLTGL